VGHEHARQIFFGGRGTGPAFDGHARAFAGPVGIEFNDLEIAIEACLQAFQSPKCRHVPHVTRNAKYAPRLAEKTADLLPVDAANLGLVASHREDGAARILRTNIVDECALVEQSPVEAGLGGFLATGRKPSSCTPLTRIATSLLVAAFLIASRICAFCWLGSNCAD